MVPLLECKCRRRTSEASVLDLLQRFFYPFDWKIEHSIVASHGECSLVISQSSSFCTVKGSKPNPCSIPCCVSDLCCIFSPWPLPHTFIRPLLVLDFFFCLEHQVVVISLWWCSGEINHIEGK
ncbi:hypothetical protein V8G54_028177 [Vigna mungo]|uniref:Uncharacterized protein n=1 Tax=Vigna mungo TaxID=3915 RepID=A0AAQ3RJ49_VIGMU